MYSFLDGLQCAYNSNKSKYENRMNYKDMTNEEIEYQLEWSDEQEFGTNYAKFLREENKQLKEKIDNVNKYIDDLLEKDIDKTILEAIKFMLGDKENE